MRQHRRRKNEGSLKKKNHFAVFHYPLMQMCVEEGDVAKRKEKITIIFIIIQNQPSSLLAFERRDDWPASTLPVSDMGEGGGDLK